MHNLPVNSIKSGQHPIISAQNILNGSIDFNAKRYVDDETFLKERKRTQISRGDVLLTIIATIGRTAIVQNKIDFLLQRSVCVLKPTEIVDSRYLKYWLDSKSIQDYMIANAHGSAQAGLYLNQVQSIKIDLPSLQEQKKISDLLDRYDEYCYDLNIGLPAEIEARQKQHEYYRDKLLTFKKLEE